MNGTIITIPVTGPVLTRKLVGEEPTVDMLKQAIGGGYIETVPYFDRIEVDGEFRACVAFCDEEGKLKKFLVNPRANTAWIKALTVRKKPFSKPHDFLVGDIAVVYGDKQFMAAL